MHWKSIKSRIPGLIKWRADVLLSAVYRLPGLGLPCKYFLKLHAKLGSRGQTGPTRCPKVPFFIVSFKVSAKPIDIPMKAIRN